jgi:hypothetical protein
VLLGTVGVRAQLRNLRVRKRSWHVPRHMQCTDACRFGTEHPCVDICIVEMRFRSCNLLNLLLYLSIKTLIPTKERQEDLRVPLFFPERRAGVSRCTAALAHSVPNRQQVPITCGTRLFKPDGLLRRRYLSCDAMDADSAVSH